MEREVDSEGLTVDGDQYPTAIDDVKREDRQESSQTEIESDGKDELVRLKGDDECEGTCDSELMESFEMKLHEGIHSVACSQLDILRKLTGSFNSEL